MKIKILFFFISVGLSQLGYPSWTISVGLSQLDYLHVSHSLYDMIT